MEELRQCSDVNACSFWYSTQPSTAGLSTIGTGVVVLEPLTKTTVVKAAVLRVQRPYFFARLEVFKADGAGGKLAFHPPGEDRVGAEGFGRGRLVRRGDVR